MSGLLFGLLAALLTGLGARDMVLVARIASANGSGGGLVTLVVASALVSSALAAAAAAWVLPMLAPDARVMLAAFALGLAGVESLLARSGRRLGEPTHSLGAIALVLFALQISDALRFVAFGLAVATAAPAAVALGAGTGSAVLLVAAAYWPEQVAEDGLRNLRRAVGVVLLGLGIWLGVGALP